MLLEEVRLTGPLGRALRTVRLSPAVDTFDRVLARYRSHLGRFVPEGPACTPAIPLMWLGRISFR